MPASTAAETLTIIGSGEPPASKDGPRKIMRSPDALKPLKGPGTAEVPIDKIQANFEKTVDGLRRILQSGFEKNVAGLVLKEVEVHIEVTADGKVGLLGWGAAVHGTTGIKLTLSNTALPKA